MVMLGLETYNFWRRRPVLFGAGESCHGDGLDVRVNVEGLLLDLGRCSCTMLILNLGNKVFLKLFLAMRHLHKILATGPKRDSALPTVCLSGWGYESG